MLAWLNGDADKAERRGDSTGASPFAQARTLCRPSQSTKPEGLTTHVDEGEEKEQRQQQ